MSKEVIDKLDNFFSNYQLSKYSKGENLILAGSDPKQISYIKRGFVEEYDISETGNKIVVNIFKPNSFFPMSWAINNTKNTFFFSAMTDIEIIKAPPDKVIEFIKSNPDVLFDLLSRVYKGTDILLRRLFISSSGQAHERLMFELLVESYRCGIDYSSQKKRVKLKVKQSILAERSGLARETVSRELHKLESEKIIGKKDNIILINIENLESRLGLL